MKKIIASLLVSGLLAPVTFCVGAVDPKLKPSDFTKWEHISIKKFGFTVDVPKDRRDDWVSNSQFDKSAGHGLYTLALHPIRIGPLIEDRYVISAYFVVMTAEQYRIICDNKGYSSYGTAFADTLHVFHKDMQEYHIDNYGKPAAVFRKDYLGRNGQVIAVSIVRYDYYYAESLRESDVAAIQRILASVEFKK